MRMPKRILKASQTSAAFSTDHPFSKAGVSKKALRIGDSPSIVGNTVSVRIGSRSKRALVAGAAGFIGSHLCSHLLARGYRVFGVDNYLTGQHRHMVELSKNPRFEFYLLDVTEPAFLNKFSAIHLDEIYNLACPTGVPNLERLAEEMLLTCSVGARNLLELARVHGAKLLFTSTAEIYGQPEVVPIPETYSGNVHPLGPRSAYEEGKRFAESLHAMYVRKYHVDARIVRVFNTYGPNMSLDDKRVIPQFIGSILHGQPLVIYGDGSQTRTHIYVDDQIQGFATVLQSGRPGEVYNIGGTEQITIRELAESILNLSGAQNTIAYTPHFIEDHHRRQPSVEKITALGWQPTVSLEVGIVRMLEAYGCTKDMLSLHGKKTGVVQQIV
jgi:UDP-glucuronate decarboxylase